MSNRLPRRTFLAGAGTLLGLPLLEAMLPKVAHAQTAPIRRFMTFHFPIGVNRQAWAPSGTETNWTLGQSQASLAKHKADITVITKVDNSGQVSGGAGHTCNAATFLTARDVPSSTRAVGTSADQVIAATFAGKTRFRSLELGTAILNENPNNEAGYDSVLKDHLSWSNNTPLPKEINPSALFDRLFASGVPGGTVDPKAVAMRKHFGQSVIDSVRADAKRLQARLGKNDNVKLDQYLTGIREVEQRIQATASTTVCSAGTRPGPPADVRDRLKQMIDLSVLAFSCDLTRVITLGYEHTVTEQAHPWVGVAEGYHIGVTHNQPGAAYAAVNGWIVSQLAYLLDKMKAVTEGTNTLLDNSLVYFASELGEGSSHSGGDIPMIVCGKGGGAITKQGRLLNRPGQGNGNVLISLMQGMGVSVNSFGNGFTSPLPGLLG